MAVESTNGEIEETALVQIVKSSGLEQTKANFILEKFQDYFRIAAEWEARAKTLIVTSSDQTTVMKMAREGRLLLRAKRIDIEHARKELKEQSLREGKAIDGIANVLRGLIEPIEEYLERQERFVELQEEAQKKELSLARQAELVSLGMIPDLYDLVNMPQGVYDAMIGARKEELRREEEARVKAEEERVAREAEEKRIREENERLKREREEQERVLTAERAKAEAEQRRLREESERKEREAEARAKAEREAAEAAARKAREEAQERERKLKAEQEAKLLKERKERERVEAELRAKEEAEAKEKKRQEAEVQKAALAPDKAKLQKLSGEIAALPLPGVKSKEAQAILVDVRTLLKKIASLIEAKCANL